MWYLGSSVKGKEGEGWATVSIPILLNVLELGNYGIDMKDW
jgi:hypothetical protein